jgi:arylsulfatase
MNRTVGFLFFCLLCAAASPSFAGNRPNVILLITDDQGYPDLSCHGNPVLQTPHLDRWHAQGVRFTDFHVAPMCTPTRGQLLTGRDAARNGAVNVSSGRALLRAELPTLANFLGDAGYRTGIFGKWHLGDNYPYRPQDRGFQETLWFPSSHISSTPDFWDNDYFDDTFRRNGVLTPYPGYCTDVFFGEAIAWMKRCAAAGEPFFAYLPTNAPHGPLWVPQATREAMERDFAATEETGKFTKKLNPGQRQSLISFLAMIRNIDDNVGKLDQFLQEAGLFDDTIVIFLTDNGSTMGEMYFDAGMRGRKTQMWEGGHRVPCFVRWPGGDLGEPRDVDGLAQAQDLLPTLLELCGITAPAACDGISLAPVLRGKASLPEDRMIVINYSEMPHGFEFAAPDSPSLVRRETSAVLWKRWRLLRDAELYDLHTDPMQQRNVLAEHPEVAGKMRAHLDAWWAEVEEKANEPQPVVIGHEAENPLLLTACEWLDVFIDQQQQVRRADRKNGWWELEVAEAGEYAFELRRWPRESGLALRDGAPAAKVTDGVLIEGEALPIAAARLKLGTGAVLRKPVGPGEASVVFQANLKPGRTRLYTWFEDENQQALVGAYYVTVTRR